MQCETRLRRVFCPVSRHGREFTPCLPVPPPSACPARRSGSRSYSRAERNTRCRAYELFFRRGKERRPQTVCVTPRDTPTRHSPRPEIVDTLVPAKFVRAFGLPCAEIQASNQETPPMAEQTITRQLPSRNQAYRVTGGATLNLSGARSTACFPVHAAGPGVHRRRAQPPARQLSAGSCLRGSTRRALRSAAIRHRCRHSCRWRRLAH